MNEEKENALHFIGLSFCHAAICDHIKHLLQQFTTGKCPKSNCAMMGQLSEQLLVHRIIPEKERGMNVYALPNAATPGRPAIFNPEICDGCNTCVDRCPVDVFIPSPEPGKSPIILHPEECWYCGTCVNDCPRPGAIEFNWPLQQRGYWKRIATGKVFRV
jgi:NAD-dependent dihydropyrimidine dehydrogenase PreA subunit